MHQHFQDILERIAEPPSWFDENGTPRYGAFGPERVNNIYVQEAALAEIECQACRTRFRVALTDALASRTESLGDTIRLRTVDYGDPPNMNCCPAGPTMSSVMRHIAEYWYRDYEIGLDWIRDPRLEGPVVEPALVAPDTLRAISDVIAAGAGAVRVQCSSRQNRYDLAGRLVACLAEADRVLVAFPLGHVVMARKMLDGLVPEADIARKDDGIAKVTLAPFERLGAVALDGIASVVILSGATKPHPNAIKQCDDFVAWLQTSAPDKLRAEFVLEHSDRLLADPEVEIDVVAMIAAAASVG